MGTPGLIGGNLTVEVTTADPHSLLSMLQNSGVVLKNVVCKDDLTWQFDIFHKKYNHLCDILSKRNEDHKVIKKSGMIWQLQNLRCRSLLLLGLAVLVLLTLYLPTRLLFISVEGNQSVSAEIILEEAAHCGIHFGASRKAVRSEKVKNRLLLQLPQLKWACINTFGCRAVITVKERNANDVVPEPKGVVSIIAQRDGIIQELSVLKGSPQCGVGEAVHMGQVLISGYTDCGITMLGQQAKGEVIAKTTRNVRGIYLKPIPKDGGVSSKEKIFGLLLGKNLIKICKDSGNLDAKCDKIYKWRYMSLPGGFQLPVAALIIRQVWNSKPMTYKESDALIDELLSDYLLQQMVSGKVSQSHRCVWEEDGCIRFEGIYYCLESIGVAYEEREIIEYEQRN